MSKAAAGLLFLCCCAWAQELPPEGGDDGVQLEALPEILATPKVQTEQPAAPPEAGPTSAYDRAEADLIASLSERQQQGLTPKPDGQRVEACLRLLMRLHTSELRFGQGWKRYPADKDFARATVDARMRLTGHLAKLGKADVAAEKRRADVSKLLLDVVKRLARSMPVNLAGPRAPPQPPEPSGPESRWLSPPGPDKPR
ncbi:MAG: hypothetical protein HY927_07175 [Elusimicrobia bacterium]|nr:hypothetical protein [Elusimicrobiota bacterium]